MTQTAENKLTVTTPSDLEIVLTREFNAPRELVFEATTKPEHVRKWWGCDEYPMTVCDIDFRVGGSYRYVIAGNGEEFPFTGVYQQIERPEQIVHTEIYDVEPFRNFPAMVTVKFEDIGGRTRLVSTVRHETKEARDGHLNSGMEGGASIAFDRLEKVLADLQG